MYNKDLYINMMTYHRIYTHNKIKRHETMNTKKLHLSDSIVFVLTPPISPIISAPPVNVIAQSPRHAAKAADQLTDPGEGFHLGLENMRVFQECHRTTSESP